MAKSRFGGSSFPGNSSLNRGAVGNPHGKKLDRDASQKSFTESASKTHRLNMPNRLPMRGGIRL